MWTRLALLAVVAAGCAARAPAPAKPTTAVGPERPSARVPLGAIDDGSGEPSAARARWRQIAIEEQRLGNHDLATEAWGRHLRSLGLATLFAEIEGSTDAARLRSELHTATAEAL